MPHPSLPRTPTPGPSDARDGSAGQHRTTTAPGAGQARAGEAGPELIIDSFAGGGGASTGIEMALGRSPDYAINHDSIALALHQANHPETIHLSKNVWHVDPLDVVGRRPVGLAWFSPDCKHFSKAKGGAPVKRNIRDLAWVVVLWAKRARPRVIILENVEEFRTWGPLTADNQPCPERKGQTFEKWCAELRRLGYKVQFRELRACDYGAPTIRKRLFVIARRDGAPIVWPAPTHGDPKSAAVQRGDLPAWRTAASIIDWSLPCPSIFDTSEEIWRKHGLRAKRPLAEATLRRIARGIRRYVLETAAPFIVPTNHGGGPGRAYGLDAPLPTITTGGSGRGEHALVTPFVSYAQQGGANRSAEDPLHTLCASPKDQNTLIAPTLVQTGYGEREGQEPRALDLGAPIGTQVAGGSKHALVAAFLAQHNTGLVGHTPDEPVSTIVQKGCTQALVAAHLTKFQTGSTGSDLADPVPTVTANSYIKRPGGAAPIGLVAANLVTLRGTSTAHGVEEPVRTVTSGGGHAGLIAAFLAKYYGAGDPSQAADEPMHTLTAKPRHGLVTVEIAGEPYAIVDIGMRMLTPRERFRAQGFPDAYEIEHGVLPDGSRVRLTMEQQGRACGNSVCPDLARALVAANCADLAAGASRFAAE